MCRALAWSTCLVPSLRRYQFILFGEHRHVYEQLARVATWSGATRTQNCDQLVASPMSNHYVTTPHFITLYKRVRDYIKPAVLINTTMSWTTRSMRQMYTEHGGLQLAWLAMFEVWVLECSSPLAHLRIVRLRWLMARSSTYWLVLLNGAWCSHWCHSTDRQLTPIECSKIF